MKRFVFSCCVAVVAAATFSSCENSNGKTPETTDDHSVWVMKCEGEYGDSCGYADTSGKMQVPLKKYAICFTDTFRRMAIVYDQKQGCIAINRNQEKLFNVFWFDNGPDYVNEGLFRITENGKIGFADEQGNVVLPPKYDFAYPFNEGLAAFNIGCTFQEDPEGEHTSIVGGKYGFIDKTGKEVIAPQFDWAMEFANGEASVKRNDTTYVIDKTGKILRRK